MKKNILSIVMATYNGERFLRRQLDSLYRQTLQPDEVLVVDDCSTDGTVSILEEYHKSHGLRYVVNEHNLRVNKNFEKALKLCTGDYIMFCDQDDVWMDNKIEIHYKKMQEIEDVNLPCLVTSRNTFVDKDLNIHHTTELDKDTDDYRDTILYHLSQGSAMMMNRKCLDYIFPFPDMDKGVCYDFHVGYMVSMIGKKYDLKQSLMYYRVHEDNLTAMLDISHHSEPLIHKRSTSIVAEHFIRTFEFGNRHPFSKYFILERKLYVGKIIRIAHPKGYFSHMWNVFLIGHVPFSTKIHSMVRATANLLVR